MKIKKPITTVFVFISVFLAGCNNDPIITSTPSSPSLKSISNSTDSPRMPTVTATAVESESQLSNNASEVINFAVMHLINATSFEMTAHEIRAYQIIAASGATSRVYGEFNSNYSIIRDPSLKVYESCEYRFDPQVGFLKYESYTYQENDRYLKRFIDNSILSAPEVVNYPWIEPTGGDIYQTLANYSDHAEFRGEKDGTLVFTIDHPKWYTLREAIGFADLGFLFGQEDGEILVEQYVINHYPDVETIQFYIYIDIESKTITRVEVDNRNFMNSLWAEVDRALVEQGAERRELKRYEILDANKSEYMFSNYGQVQDFEIPE